jgi:3-deoxy-D-manno-octulosonic-acid transferase
MIAYRTLTASDLKVGVRSQNAFTESGLGGDGLPAEVIVLDTIGDLAAVYGIADVVFVGGSLVDRGGHNPLEPAQFGVPVVIGPSFENFRDIVAKMQAADAIRIVQDMHELEAALIELLTDREAARAMGERGRQVFEAQQGATARAVEALLRLVKL